MTDTYPVLVLDDADTLMRRLSAAAPEPHLIERFYPLLAAKAGSEVAPGGIAVMLTLAISDYTEGMPPFMADVMHLRLPKFAAALVGDNPAFMTEVNEFLGSLKES